MAGDAGRRAGRVGARHRLRRGRDARLPRLGHARHRPANEHPESFHQADVDEAAGRLVAVIRRTRPQVIITYGDDQQGYPHPDHLKVHDISVLAFDRAGDPDWYPEAGEPVPAAQAVLLDVVAGPDEGDPRGAARPPRQVAVRRAVVRPPRQRPPDHDPHRRQPSTSGPARPPCGRTPPRSTRKRGSGSPSTTPSWPRSTRGRTGSSPARWSGRSPTASAEHDLFDGVRDVGAQRPVVTPPVTTTVQYRVIVGKKDELVDGPDDADVVITVPLAEVVADGFDPDGRLHAGQAQVDRLHRRAVRPAPLGRRGDRAQPARIASLSSA